MWEVRLALEGINQCEARIFTQGIATSGAKVMQVCHSKRQEKKIIFVSN